MYVTNDVLVFAWHIRARVFDGAPYFHKRASKMRLPRDPPVATQHSCEHFTGLSHKFLEFLAPSLKKARHSSYRSVCFI
jgi:hypothetical protein